VIEAWNWAAYNIHVTYSDCGNTHCNFGFRKTGTLADWDYYYPSEAEIRMTMSVRADHAIGIDFSGSEDGSVSIRSNAPVVLDGKITNPDGATTITTTVGSVTATDAGAIVTKTLEIQAASAIGAAPRPLAVALADAAPEWISARAGAGGIFLAVGSGARLRSVVAGAAATGWGDVVIAAEGALEGDAAATGTHVSGRSLTLSSQTGGIGTAARPLEISAHPTAMGDGRRQHGVVDISAAGDVVVRQVGGDLLVGTIRSTGGDVRVDVTAGNALDARGQTASSVLTEEQMEAVWTRLKLTGAAGAAAHADASIAAFESLVERNYVEYWRLLLNGDVVNGSYTLRTLSIPLYRPLAAAALGRSPSNADVQGYAAYLYRSMVAFFDNADLPADPVLGLPAIRKPLQRPGAAPPLGSAWRGSAAFTAFDELFTFDVSDDQRRALVDNQWTISQLRYAVDLAALGAPGPVGIGVPNIVGRRVEVRTTAGSIGGLDSPLFIGIDDLKKGTLTAAQQIALALAASPGDVTMVGKDAGGAEVTFVFGFQPAGVTVTGIRVKRTAPFFVDASGTFHATASGAVYVQSTATDMTVGLVTAQGAVSLAAPGHLLAASNVAPHVVSPGDVRLQAGTGNIAGSDSGAPSSAFVLRITGRLTAATAGGAIFLRQLGGDLQFERIDADGDVRVDVPAGSLLQQAVGTGIKGDAIRLDVAKTVGTADTVIQVELSTTRTCSSRPEPASTSGAWATPTSSG
jgi:hypothetical protein